MKILCITVYGVKNGWRRKKLIHILLNELRFPPKDWHSYLRTNERTYVIFLFLIIPLIKKTGTVMRNVISPYDSLTTTLRFFATGRSYLKIFKSSIIWDFPNKDYLKVRKK